MEQIPVKVLDQLPWCPTEEVIVLPLAASHRPCASSVKRNAGCVAPELPPASTPNCSSSCCSGTDRLRENPGETRLEEIGSNMGACYAFPKKVIKSHARREKHCQNVFCLKINLMCFTL